MKENGRLAGYPAKKGSQAITVNTAKHSERDVNIGPRMGVYVDTSKIKILALQSQACRRQQHYNSRCMYPGAKRMQVTI